MHYRSTASDPLLHSARLIIEAGILSADDITKQYKSIRQEVVNAIGVLRDIPGIVVATCSRGDNAALVLRECVRMAGAWSYSWNPLRVT